MALIAEDLLLLLLDDDTGRLRSAGQIRPVLGGALLLELALSGAVDVDDSSTWRPTHLQVAPTAVPPADPLLAAALAGLGPDRQPATSAVHRLGKGVKQQVIDRLVAAGQVRVGSRRVLGVIPRTAWPAVSRDHEQEVRRDLTVVLTSDLTVPTPRTAALVTLLYAAGRVAQSVDHPGLGNGDVRRRAKTVIAGAWADDRVRQAMTGINSAIAAVTSD